MTSPEQRRFRRKSLAVDFSGSDAEGHGELLFEGADLSQGGAFLKSELLLEPDELLALEFRLPGRQRALKAQARVVWARRFPEAGEPAGMGVAFLAMEDGDRVALDGYLSAT